MLYRKMYTQMHSGVNHSFLRSRPASIKGRHRGLADHRGQRRSPLHLQSPAHANDGSIDIDSFCHVEKRGGLLSCVVAGRTFAVFRLNYGFVFHTREHQNASDYDGAVVIVQNVSNVSQHSDIEQDPVELSDDNETAPVAECTYMYMPILTSLQQLLKKFDVFEKVQETKSQMPGQYTSHCDGSYYQENLLFSDEANLPVKNRSAFHSTQLALLCNSNNVQQFGYAKVFAPLLSELKTLEELGVYIETVPLRESATVYSVVADNLGANGLAGFSESFRATYFCRFCLATQTEMQTSDAVTGFPPDILHDLFEGLVPVELAHCLKDVSQRPQQAKQSESKREEPPLKSAPSGVPDSQRKKQAQQAKQTDSELVAKEEPPMRSGPSGPPENGSKTGYEGWQNSLRFRMGNYRTKLSRAGIKDVAVNPGKRSRTNPDGSASRANIKRPRRGEVNFLPNYPNEKTKDTLETQRLEMVEQFKRTSIERDMILIHHHMQRTFALRGEEIVNSALPIGELKDRWPALFCEAQDKNNISAARTAALAGLPLYLKEDSSDFFKTCKVKWSRGTRFLRLELVLFHNVSMNEANIVEECTGQGNFGTKCRPNLKRLE
ncbi:hypothetical protein F2P81_001326 [Scophthalmus maximus]|uniref:Uncharacterized protein n=1 Tax=Scophthalmus maximus TaxID=52904 RepID=A0A6A4TND0_SCOMX|nr:hypothetical protein F2P81_001326 [Scophthalmus maximus]